MPGFSSTLDSDVVLINKLTLGTSVNAPDKTCFYE